ncbi:hypothetical protein DPMN_059545 [Dreissena polymorpha]|uniref:Uncharacterized protein n=1 Tax=Dreissena polymorpha TaxID=45954 RepID=A0A9D4C3P2_DREPO|nr:hypothetical protein DPMN_059545 [Dreissena polymorpha]
MRYQKCFHSVGKRENNVGSPFSIQGTSPTLFSVKTESFLAMLGCGRAWRMFIDLDVQLSSAIEYFGQRKTGYLCDTMSK